MHLNPWIRDCYAGDFAKKVTAYNIIYHVLTVLLQNPQYASDGDTTMLH